MPKLKKCDRCQFYAHNPHIICAVHPSGVNSDSCQDFEEDPCAGAYELWEPVGARYIENELVLSRNHLLVDGIEIIQLDLTSWHPMHTGKCPRCGCDYERDYTARVHYDCPDCGWMDDSV
jgi:hypothetical protein